MHDLNEIISRSVTHAVAVDAIESGLRELMLSPWHAEARAVREKFTVFMRQAAMLALSDEVPKPASGMIRAGTFANQVAAVLRLGGGDDLRETAMTDLRCKHAAALRHLHASSFATVYMKLGSCVTQVAWMLRHDLDPDDLRLMPLRSAG